MPKILIDGIVGARPNMMKMTPLARKLASDNTFALRVIHTGQHYDNQMSQVFFEDLGLQAPHYNLEAGSGPHGRQTGRILERYEEILLSERKPRGVIVVGDVNSTLACTLAAVKLGVPVAHVEAGLRSWDRSMPEEINRVATDALSDLFFVSDPDGLINLSREGHTNDKIRLVGNIMIDNLFRELPAIEASTVLTALGLTAKEYAYVTLHRPSNVDDKATLRKLMTLLDKLSQEIRFAFSVHPRCRVKLAEAGIQTDSSERFRFISPLNYADNLRLIKDARAVLTDSGGMQEECSVLDVPCLTLRDNTERPITVELGTCELVGNDPDRIRQAWVKLSENRWKQASQIPLWDGHTADRIVDDLCEAWG